jgi:hypothetical protein
MSDPYVGGDNTLLESTQVKRHLRLCSKSDVRRALWRQRRADRYARKRKPLRCSFAKRYAAETHSIKLEVSKHVVDVFRHISTLPCIAVRYSDAR